MRQKDSIKNVIFNLLSFLVTTGLGIIIPRLFLVSYGSEVNGLINSIRQIFAYFTLLEAGVGSATTQALYGPVAKKEHREVSAILSATNKFYRRSGIIYGAAVITLAAAYPFLVDTNIAKLTVVVIILFSGMIGVIRYLVTAKLQLLMVVDGKSYIITNLGTVFSIVSDLVRIGLMYAGADILWVQGMYFVISICQIVFIVAYTKKHYSWLNLREEPDYRSISQRKSVLMHQISSLIFHHTDTIILTFFCGLKTVSIYVMYKMLFDMISSITTSFFGSVTFAMGQVFHMDKERYEKLQDAYETYYLSLIFALFTIGYIFILPFLRIYTNGITDVNYIDKWLPMLFLTIQILDIGRDTSKNMIEFAGHFKQTQWRAFLEASINLGVSLISVYFLGIYGVLLGTIAASLYRTNDIILYANHKIMNRSVWPTYRRWLRNIVLLLATAFAGSFLPQSYSGYLPLIGCACVVSLMVLLIFFGINSLFETAARKTAWAYAKPMIRKITHKIKS